MVPAIDIYDFLVSQRLKRLIKAKQFSDFESKNIIERQVAYNSKCFVIDDVNTDQYRNSFFVKTVLMWNHLDENTISAQAVKGFRSSLSNCY